MIFLFLKPRKKLPGRGDYRTSYAYFAKHSRGKRKVLSLLCSSSLFESSLSTSVLSLSGIPCFFVFELTRLQALRPPPSTALLTLFSSNLMSFVVSFVLILYS